MHPFERLSSDLPKGVATHLNALLKPGWRFDRRRCAIVSASGHAIRLKQLLPRGAKVVPTVPSLLNADPKSLSEDQSVLARSLQVVLPSASMSDVNPSELAAELSRLDGMESVAKGPRLALP